MKDVIALLALAAIVYFFAARAGWLPQSEGAAKTSAAAAPQQIFASNRSASTTWVEPAHF